METYLNKGIKDTIKSFPEIENILTKFNIGCAPCSVGTCLLKDIVEVHNLSYEQEEKLMEGIAEIIYPGRSVVMQKIERKIGPTSGEIKYSPPIKRLVEEHVFIKKLIALIPVITASIDVKNDGDKQLILDCIDFIRSYADKYHHAKEEVILFKKFSAELDIIKVMFEEHTIGRNHIKAAIEAIDRSDNVGIREHLASYGRLLAEHIRKEDEILYPWMDRNLSMSQVGELFSQFDEVNKEFMETSQKFEGFIDALEKQFKKEEYEK